MKIKGVIKEIIFPNKVDYSQSGLNMVFLFVCDSEIKKTYKASGYIVPIKKGDYLELEGAIEGNEFHFSSYGFVEDNEIGATVLLKFLFGNKNAIKIIQAYRNNAVTAVSNFKEWEQSFRNVMESVRGISNKTINKAYDKYLKNETAEKIYIKLSSFGLSLDNCIKIFKILGFDSMELIKNEPYSLFYRCHLDFKIVDDIALNYSGINELDPKRILAGVYATLIDFTKQGHCYAYRHSNKKDYGLVEIVSKRLRINEGEIQKNLIDLHREGKINIDKFGNEDIIYLSSAYEAEVKSAEHLGRLNGKTNFTKAKILRGIESFEEKNGFKLAEKQKEAIINSCQHKLSIITGPPGSGKTTIIAGIVDVLKSFNKKTFALSAPTGKAANRMSFSTGMEASTVHKMLKYSPVSGDFTFNIINKLPFDVIIVDEVSMIGLSIFSKLVEAVSDDTMIIFVGDYDQLPSVDYGKVLEDMIVSERIPKVMLNEVYRQKKGSTLSKRILGITKGEMFSVKNTNDFTFVEKENNSDMVNSLLARFEEELVKTKGNYSKIAVLSPVNDGEVGCNNLNLLLQEKLNPAGRGRDEVKIGKKVFRVGDLVIQTTNENEFNVFNGMVGIVSRIEKVRDVNDVESIEVQYPEGKFEYTRDRYDNLKLAYALTIHKTQGSEYDSVIFLSPNGYGRFLDRRLIYTGMSRAKKHLIMIGSEETVRNAIIKTGEIKRNSRLKHRIQQEIPEYVAGGIEDEL